MSIAAPSPAITQPPLTDDAQRLLLGRALATCGWISGNAGSASSRRLTATY